MVAVLSFQLPATKGSNPIFSANLIRYLFRFSLSFQCPAFCVFEYLTSSKDDNKIHFLGKEKIWGEGERTKCYLLPESLNPGMSYQATILWSHHIYPGGQLPNYLLFLVTRAKRSASFRLPHAHGC